LKALEQTNHPVILIGDFNANPKSPSIALFKKDWQNIPKQGPSMTIPANKPIKEIDYIMTRGIPAKRLSCKVINEKIASDHRPLFMTLPWKKE
jgi:endonuclease/exonuclease/phosphatase family metal-dependent hydrolase